MRAASVVGFQLDHHQQVFRAGGAAVRLQRRAKLQIGHQPTDFGSMGSLFGECLDHITVADLAIVSDVDGAVVAGDTVEDLDIEFNGTFSFDDSD
ncbi:MAG: hypothetical protein ACQETO_03915, partial [Pseudomonadota bacterium]